MNDALDGKSLASNVTNTQNIQDINRFIKHFKKDESNTLYDESSTNQIGVSKGNVQLFTKETLNLTVKKSVYKLGLAVINNRLIINTKDYNIFPFTISDFYFTKLDINNGNDKKQDV